MKTYGRNAKVTTKPGKQAPANQEDEAQEAKGVRINGFQQVVELLKAADPEFRMSLLRRIIQQDPQMGKMLQQDLTKHLR